MSGRTVVRKMLHSVVMLEESIAIDLAPLELQAMIAPRLLLDYWLVAPSSLLTVPELQMQSFVSSDETLGKTS